MVEGNYGFIFDFKKVQSDNILKCSKKSSTTSSQSNDKIICTLSYKVLE